PSDDPWRLDAILYTPSRLSLTNLHTGHILELGTDNVREFRTPDFLLLRCKLTVQPGNVEIEPFVERYESNLTVSPATETVGPIHLDDLIDVVSKHPFI